MKIMSACDICGRAGIVARMAVNTEFDIVLKRNKIVVFFRYYCQHHLQDVMRKDLRWFEDSWKAVDRRSRNFMRAILWR